MIKKIMRSRLGLAAAIISSAGLAVAPAQSSKAALTIELCSADGKTRTISIPVDEDDDPQDDHCAKPCHVCQSRKSKPDQVS